MARFLIVYATVEGQTRKIAAFIADQLRKRRNDAVLVDAADAPADLDVGAFDAVIVASPVHMDRHHGAIVHFVKEHARELQKRPAAFISVSLHAISDEPEDREAMRQYVDNFCRDAAWIPHAVCYAAGALKFTEYDFFKRLAARRVAREQGFATRVKDDYEFTDWTALTRFIDEFVSQHAPGA
jgi:menaquinone-dependent protoporphyrinogen oxidase